MSLSMHGMSSWMSEYAWISSTATPARNAASASPPTASEQARTSSGRRRLPPSSTPSRIAAAATDLRSLARPVLQLPVLEHLHLIFRRLQPVAAAREQLGSAPAAVEQAVQRHLAALHGLHQTFQLGDR